MFSICRRRHSRAGSAPAAQACSQSRHRSFGEYRSISSSSRSPWVSVLSKSKKRTGLCGSLRIRYLPLDQRTAEFLQSFSHPRTLAVGGDEVIRILEEHELPPLRADALEDEPCIARARHVVVLGLHHQDRRDD